MKMKNMIAVMAATAVAATGFAAMSLSAGAADTVYGIASLNGQMGTYQKWDQEGSAQITGDGQYEATWDITGDGTGTIEFLILEIKGSDETNEDLKNFTKDQYVDLGITIDEIAIDGTVYTYTDNEAAYKLSHYEGNGRVRVYLTETWGNVNAGEDLGVQSAVTQQIKVKFTVSGMPAAEAPTEAETPAPTEAETQAPAGETTAAATTAAGSTTAAATTTAKATAGTTTNAATGDTGIAVALAGLTVAGAVALVSKKRK